MKSVVRFVSLVAFAVLFLSTTSDAFAQSYPTKPIRFVVGFPPGGSTDIAARVIAGKLSESLGQPVVVDNRPGAGSNIGTEIAAKAAPDGYTLLMATVANASNYTLYKLPFDFVRDFAPVTQATSVTSSLVVHPSLPVKSVKELIELAKSKPGQLNHSSTGIGGTPHLAAEMFKLATGVDMVHIPYKGAAPELTDLLAGVVNISFATLPGVLPQIKAGKLRILAVSSHKRTPLLPDVPTMSEAGLPGFVVTSWNGVAVPAGTSKEIITRLHSEIVKILQMPDVKERLAGLGADPVGNTPEEFGSYIRSEINKWAKVVKEAKVRIE